jgi:3-dehydroquinate synthase
VVSEDEREAGRRAVLNAGHTVGHAVERVSGYGLLHGDAVSIGLAVEADLAERALVARPPLAEPVRALLSRLDRPVRLNRSWRIEAVLEAMQHDKKTRDGTVRFALPNTLGASARDGDRWTVPVPVDLVRTVLRGSRA